ncbi:MAG: ATP-binding protein [Ferruginibacter sp.]
MQTITGEIRVVLAITLLLLLITTFVIFFVFFYQKRYRQHRKETLELEVRFAETLRQSRFEIQEQTLKHISRELHDNLGQIASLIKINLNTIRLSDIDKTAEKIENTKDLTRQLIGDIKSLSVSLGSDRISKIGLAKAIETEVEQLNKTGEFVASYNLSGTMPLINGDKEIILYRIVQEVFNNMVKHSQATNIDILISVSENLFNLAMHDNGMGFNVEEKMKGTGAGLQNLISRASLINAQLNIQSTPGAGTRITIALPL